MEEEITIYLECPHTDILGVFGKDIHLQTHGFKIVNPEEVVKIEVGKSYPLNEFSKGTEDFECVLIVPEKVYLEEWKKWIKGKRDYCERYDEYCGVMGYVHPINPEYIGNQKINKWNEKKEDYDILEVPVYKANKFTDRPDFEHG